MLNIEKSALDVGCVKAKYVDGWPDRVFFGPLLYLHSMGGEKRFVSYLMQLLKLVLLFRALEGNAKIFLFLLVPLHSLPVKMAIKKLFFV